MDKAKVSIVDTHAHLFTKSMQLVPDAWHVPPAEADADQYIATLDAQGVSFGVLAAASISGTNNDHTLAACRRHSRLRTTVIVPPDCSLQAMKEMAASGAVGVRFQWRNVVDLPDLSSNAYRSLLRHVAELDWHVQLHDDAFRLPAYLPALEAAGVKVVVDHFGRPDTAYGIHGAGFKRLLRSIEGGRTWVKLSAPFRLLSDSLVQQAGQALLEHAGPERLMWGSDWPFAAFEDSFTYDMALASLAELVPDATTRRRISCDTPLAFYFS
jgi:predicted TIM-barrel fold metal-dependent hydrolase